MLLFFLLAGHAFGQQDQSSKLASLMATAQQAQAANNYAAAAAAYQKAVKFRPDIPELWANLGLMQHESGDYAEAIRSFQQAIRLKPSLYVPSLFLGVDYVHTGQAREAIPLLIKAEKMNAGDALPPVTLGRAYASLNDHAAAIREFRRAIRIDPKQSSPWFDLGISQLDEVEQDARAMTSQHPDSPYAKALFAESLVEQSRYKEAADLYKGILASDSQTPCMRSEAGFLSLKQGDTQNADLQFKAERSQHPECSMALLGEARLNIDEGDNHTAIQLIQQTWDRDHSLLAANAPLLFDGLPAARAQEFLNDLAGAQSSGQIDQSLYTALTQPPPTTQHDAHCAGVSNRNQAALETLAACSFFAGDYDLTYDTAHALQSLPSHPQAQALYWAIKANEKLALESLAHFQELAPNSAQSHLLLGDIYRQRERYDDAQKEYSKALDLSPNETAALLGLASSYYGDQNIGKTLEIAQKALAQSPHDPDVNLLMGEALLSQHKFADAKPYLLNALNAKPQILPHVHALLGEAYAADNKPQDAIRELKLGASSDQDGSVHYYLARIYNKLGDTADAAAAIQQMKALQQRRREGAVIAVEDAHPSTLDDAP